MRVLAVGFVAYVAVLFSTSLVAIYLLRPIAAELKAPLAEASAPRAPTDWQGALASALDALRGRAAAVEPNAHGGAGVAAAAPTLGVGTVEPATPVATPRPAEPPSNTVLLERAPDAIGDAAPTLDVGTVEPATPVAIPRPAEPPSNTVLLERALDAISDAAPSAPARAPEIAILLQRGDALLATGDLAAARLFYLRAAERGDGAAASGVAKTYDPLFLEQAGFRHLPGDAALAAVWYRQAVDAGDADAARRLEQLLARGPVRNARQ